MPEPVYQRELGCKLLSTFHSDDIFLLAIVQMWGQFVAEADITIGAFSQVVSVNPNLTVAVNAVEFDEVVFVVRGGWKRKCLSCTRPRSGRQETTGSPGRRACRIEKDPSMLQSCGRSSCLHSESSKSTVMAEESVPSMNFQSSSKSVTVRRALWVNPDRPTIRIKLVTVARILIRFLHFDVL